MIRPSKNEEVKIMREAAIKLLGNKYSYENLSYEDLLRIFHTVARPPLVDPKSVN